ncbi:MAG: L-glutamate gamma-semialdehyde dehydrogenase, partial [Bacteroidales bacterium]|nr:L-glutamate gamma-semialdehyde dehydrogenase [Bacteroidales bacterium]
NAIYSFKIPSNLPVKTYGPGTEDRKLLKEALKKIQSEVIEIPLIIGGKEVKTGQTGKVVMPHNHQHVLAMYHKAGEKEVKMAIDAALEAHKAWEEMPWQDRVAITLKVAALLEGKYRYIINAATMLGQGKNAFQAEIDSACETIDFLRFNAYYASQVYADQPISENGVINRMEYRPLEGFVFTVTPFNFTAIASNLNMTPVLMGNTTIWKPSTTSLLSNYYLMKIYMEAGVPAGVINFLPGSGATIGGVALTHPKLAGIHFTGSTGVFNGFWKTIASNVGNYVSYPKIVGETGGKDFIFAHHSADVKALSTAIIRGSFEFQGQKCSAASRAYIPKSIWEDVKKIVGEMLSRIKVGEPTDFTNFMNAVIDEASFDKCMTYIENAKKDKDAEIIFGGKGDKSKGYFVEPTVILTTNPHYASMEEEIFGPIITIYVYDDNDFNATLKLCDTTSPYALTGAVWANDRAALLHMANVLKYSSGNIYFNDKPTGAVVGQQPFGGARASGTNDKAGSYLNLIRWTNPRAIKEFLVPPTDFMYPTFLED